MEKTRKKEYLLNTSKGLQCTSHYYSNETTNYPTCEYIRI